MAGLVRPIRRLARGAFIRLAPVLEIAHAVAQDYSAKRVSILAAALAFYSFLALFPFILVILAAAGYVLHSSEQELEVVRQALDRALPTSDLQIEQQLNTIIAHRAVVGGLGLLGLVWSASNALAIFVQALRIVWEVKGRSRFLLVRLRALTLLALAIIFLLLSVLVSSAIPLIAHWRAAGVVLRLAEIRVLWRLASAAVPLTISFVTFLVLYRIVPAARIELRHVAAGAAFAAVAWEIAKGAFAWYLQRFANFDRVYGPVAAIVVLLLWMYISVVIVLIGAELASIYSLRQRGRPGGDGSVRSPLSTL
jgi:membrane protein